MATFFIADTHFGDEAVLKRENRPFVTAHQMTEQMIVWWNETVRPHDNVWHLGGVGRFKSVDEAADLLLQLNGEIRLVPSLEDDTRLLREARWDVRSPLVWAPPDLCLCHYPLEYWGRGAYNTYHYHGATFGRSRPVRYRLDVGADAIGFRPILLLDAMALASEQGIGR